MFIISDNLAPETPNSRNTQTNSCHQITGVSLMTAILFRIYHPNLATGIPVANYLRIHTATLRNVAGQIAKTRSARNNIAPYKRVPMIICITWVIVSIVRQTRISETSRLSYVVSYQLNRPYKNRIFLPLQPLRRLLRQ